MTASLKIHFHLTQDEDGYPPVAVESLWAEAGTKSGEYVIDNIPFFVRDATIGDTVRVREEKGHCWFDGVVSRSQNSLVRVVFFDQESVEKVSEQLVARGCIVEYSKDYNLMAVNIPYSVNLKNVKNYLQQEVDAGAIDFEEPILRQSS